MPELPEVETIKNVLKNILINKTITSIDVLRETTIIGDKNEFIKSLTNQTFLDITRIGKFLIFHLTNDLVLISHLRMEGKYYEVNENDRNTYFSRVVFHLNNNKKICYDDSRCFGIMILSREDQYKKVKDIAQLGPEPFNANYIDIYNKCKKSNLPFKTTLLTQTIMCGIGNIYADEICFACKIHPLTPTKFITLEKWKEVILSAITILNQAIKDGGSTIKSYHPGKDIDGNFQVNLKAYGKKDEPCPNCGHPMRFIKVNQRGTTYCPICQQKLGKPMKVAIFGPIASGKSCILKEFANKGYLTASSDKIVEEIYSRKNVIEAINNMFNFSFKDCIDKNELRKYLAKNPKDFKRLENYIHPLVIKEIDKILKSHKSDIIAIEVPLLYQAHIEDMFDYIIAVDIDEQIQLKRLKERNLNSYKELSLINKNKQYQIYYKNADIIVNNNGDIKSLLNKINQIICKLEQSLN